MRVLCRKTDGGVLTINSGLSEADAIALRDTLRQGNIEVDEDEVAQGEAGNQESGEAGNQESGEAGN